MALKALTAAATSNGNHLTHHQQNTTMSASNQLSTAANANGSCTDKCVYCQSALGSVAIKCSQCVDFYMCLKVSRRKNGQRINYFEYMHI